MQNRLPSLLMLLAGLASAALFLVLGPGLPQMPRMILKALPTALMCAWIVYKGVDRTNWPILAGIFLSLLCDVFMEFDLPLVIPGLLANLGGLVFYTIHFVMTDRDLDLVEGLPGLLVVGTLTFILWNYLGDFRLPVLVYSVMYVVFLWRAASRLNDDDISLASRQVCFTGALMVIISDSVLSLTTFGVIPDLPEYHWLVMIFWWGGLFLLALTAEIRRQAKTPA